MRVRIKRELDANPGEDKEVLLWFLESTRSQNVWNSLTSCEWVKGERHWSATDELLYLSKGFPG